MDCSTTKCYGSDWDSYHCPQAHVLSALISWPIATHRVCLCLFVCACVCVFVCVENTEKPTNLLAKNTEPPGLTLLVVNGWILVGCLGFTSWQHLRS